MLRYRERLRSAVAVGLTASLLPTLGSGCTATIHRRGRPDIEAEIVSSDAKELVVELHSRRYVVEGEQVTDIDHPGNVLTVVGAASLAYAGVGLGAFLTLDPDDPSRIGARNQALVFGSVGLFGLFGLVTWLRSTAAASALEVDR